MQNKLPKMILFNSFFFIINLAKNMFLDTVQETALFRFLSIKKHFNEDIIDISLISLCLSNTLSFLLPLKFSSLKRLGKISSKSLAPFSSYISFFAPLKEIAKLRWCWHSIIFCI